MSLNFFCGGTLKSGTTLLQRVLDSHPDISCEPEHSFKLLLLQLLEVGKRYNSKLEKVSNTIGVAPRQVEEYFFLEAFYKIIEEIFDRASEKKEICGINDNSFIVNNGEALLNKFKDHKLIYIIRNPIDTALSTWDHWFFLYKKYNDTGYLDWLQTDGRFDKDQFMIRRAKKWNRHAKYIISMLEMFPNRVLIVRYEDLNKEKELNLEKILYFLGASSNKKVVKKMSQGSTLEKMRKESTNPSFYSKARADFGADVLNKSVRREIIALTIENLRKLNYINDYEEYLS